MAALDAILFDIGGTLDGRGGWRDRFHRLFVELGLGTFSHADRVRAFDHAEQRSHAVSEMATARLRYMVQRHVGWQFERLGVNDPAIERELVDRFASDVEQAAAVNRRGLAALVEQGFRLGVVSNACGNAAVLCEELGYGSMLSAIVDSHRFGASKPDLAIFRHALVLMRTSPGRTGFVGDSLDRDILPARAIGMRTFWIADRHAQASTPAVADVMLDSIAELPARLLEVDLRPA